MGVLGTDLGLGQKCVTGMIGPEQLKASTEALPPADKRTSSRFIALVHLEDPDKNKSQLRSS